MIEWADRHPLTGFAIVLASFAMLFAFTFYALAQSSRQFEEPPASPYDERIVALQREAIEQAFRDQVTHLFQTWMRDDTGQPTRAINGTRQARKAFIASMNALDQRQQAIEERKQK